MLKIGQFSRFSQVTVKTLRYYDEIGLLKPAEVDPFTGYRYYSVRQLPRLYRIVALKDLGLSLDEIGRLLEEELSADQIRGILRLKQSEIELQVREEQARLDRVERRLRQIEQEDAAMPAQEVVIKKVPPQAVVSVRDTVPVSQIGQLLGEVFGHLGQQGVGPAGPPIGVYYDEEFREEGMDAEMAVPVAAPVPEGGRVKARDLPGAEKMACVVHEGGYDTVGITYSQLMEWIEENGYRIAGPTREIYLRGPESGDDPSTYVTEVQFPVEKG